MATINKGLALVSVADVLFFNPTTGDYMGEGLALTNSTITQEVQSIEQTGKDILITLKVDFSES